MNARASVWVEIRDKVDEIVVDYAFNKIGSMVLVQESEDHFLQTARESKVLTDPIPSVDLSLFVTASASDHVDPKRNTLTISEDLRLFRSLLQEESSWSVLNRI